MQRVDLRNVSRVGFRPVILPQGGALSLGARRMEYVVTPPDRFATIAAVQVAGKINQLQGTAKGRPVNLFITPGNTMVVFLEKLAEGDYPGTRVDWSRVNLFSIGEFVGIDRDSGLSLNAYIRKYFINLIPLRARLPDNHFFPFDDNIYSNVSSYLSKIREVGGFDLGILGIGARHGELLFNMPGTLFDSRMTLLKISPEKAAEKGLEHAHHLTTESGNDWYARVLGLGDIFDTRHLILLARGAYKHAILDRALMGKVCLDIPGTMLQLHPDLLVVADSDAASGVTPYRALNPGAARKLVSEFQILASKYSSEAAEKFLDRYLGYVVSETQMAGIIGDIDFRNINFSEARRQIQLGMMNYYHDNLHEILVSVADNQGTEAVHELFLKAVRVYQLSMIRDEIIKRKEIFAHYLLMNVRTLDSNIGSRLRSETTLELIVNEVLASTDEQVYMPALEAVVEIMVLARKSKSQLFKDAIERIFHRSSFLPRFGWRLVDILERAGKNEVRLFEMKNLSEFNIEARKIILDYSRRVDGLVQEMMEYLDDFPRMKRSFTDMDDFVLELGHGRNPS